VVGATNKQPVIIRHAVDAEIVIRVTGVFVEGVRQQSGRYADFVYI